MAYTFSSDQFTHWGDNYLKDLQRKDQLNFRKATNAIADSKGPVRNAGVLYPEGDMASIVPVGPTAGVVTARSTQPATTPAPAPVAVPTPPPAKEWRGVPDPHATDPSAPEIAAIRRANGAINPNVSPYAGGGLNIRSSIGDTASPEYTAALADVQSKIPNLSPDDAKALAMAKVKADTHRADVTDVYAYPRLFEEMRTKYKTMAQGGPASNTPPPVAAPIKPAPVAKSSGKTGLTIPKGKEQTKVKKEIANEAGLTSMPSGVVKTVLAGKTPSTPKDMTKVNVQLLNEELQHGIVARQSLFDLADAYKRAGMGAKYLEAEAALNDMTVTVRNLAQQKAINLFENNDDPRMLQKMWSEQAGKPISIMPRSDGRWNIVSNDEILYKGVTTEAITSSARTSASQAYAAGINAAAMERVSKYQEARWSLEEKALVEQIKNAGAKELKQMEMDGKVQLGSEGEIYIIRGNKLIRYKAGEGTGPDGESVDTLDRTISSIPTAGNMSSIMQQAWDRVNK